MRRQDFVDLFTTEALRCFAPCRGASGLIPTLEVYTPWRLLRYRMPNPVVHEDAACRICLHTIGHVCGQQTASIDAVRFGRPAFLTWTRTTVGPGTPPGTVLQEVVEVLGQMPDGTAARATAALYRQPNGTVAFVDTWELQTVGPLAVPLLRAFWDGVGEGRARRPRAPARG